MNKNLHRIVFNARRGQRMVVAETATSQGKSASGETRGVATIAFSAALTASLFMGGTALAQIKADPRAPATQQPTVLTTSNGVPQVNIQTPSAAGVSRNVYGQFDVNGNGAILNNSRTGTATAVGGYVQANPWLAQGSARIILNEVNSTNASQLQGPVEVAGQRAEVIIANPAGIAVSGGSFINASAVTLTTGSVVVNSGSLDSYRVQGGVVSVSGKGLDTGGADYTNILARAVQVNAGIWSSDLRVVTGTNTLSASDPVASAKRMAAASAAQAGATASSSDTVNKSGTNSDGPVGFALDVSSLGGMYAGKIFMVGTEAGMGVRNGGALGATSGDIVLSNNGWLSSSGSFYASGNTSLSTQGSQTHSGTTAAQGNLTLAATGSGGSITSTSQSLVAGGLKADGTLTGSGQTTVTASQGVSMAGKVITPGALKLTGPDVNLSGAQVQADSATITSSTPGANLHADNSKIYVTQTLNLSTGQTLHTTGATVVAKKLNIGAHSIVNTGGSLGQSGEEDLQINLTGSLDNGTGHIAGGGNVQITSNSLTNADKGSVYAAGKLDVTTGQLGNGGSLYAGGDLKLTVNNSASNAGPGGLIAAGGHTTITAGNLGNAAGASIIAGMQSDGKLISGPTAPNLSITTQSSLHNQGNLMAGGEISLRGNGGDVVLGGSTNAGGNIALRGESIGISGTLVTAKDLEVQAKSDFRIEGSGQIGGSALVTAGSGFSLDGQFTVNKDLNLTAGGVNTRPGSFLTVGHNANLSGGGGVNLGGATTVGNLLALTGKTITLTGPVDAASTAVSGGTINLGEAGGITNWKGNLSLAMSGDVNALGGLSVANSVSISSGGVVHIGGNAQSGGGLSISASGNLQVDGTVTAGDGTALTAGGNLNTLSVHGTSVSLDGQQLNVTGSVVGTTGSTHLRGTNGIAVTGDVTSGGGTGLVATTSGALDIGGTATSGAGMTLKAGTTIHLSQQTQATGAMHLEAGGNIVADKGLAGGAVAIQAQDLTVAQNILSGGALQAQTHAFNVTGNVLSGGDTQIVATPQAGAMGASTVQIGGALATTGALNVQSSGTLQVASSTQADGSLQLKAQGITLGGKTTSGGNSSINAQGAALNVAGMVGSAGNQSLAGSTITVQGAQSLGQMDLQASGGTINSTSSLLAANGLSANAAGAITVQGHIASDGATTLQSTGQVNASGTLASGAGGLKVDAGGDIAAATLQSLGDSKLNSTANVTLGNALNIGSYTVTAGGSITQAYVQSGAGLSETAGGGITHTGATLVQGNAVLASGGAQTLGNSPASGLTATGTITATATTGTISVGADLLANGNITTTATQGSIAVGGNLATQGTVGATAQNSITVGGALAGQSATLGSSAGGVQIASNVQVQTNLNVTAQTNVQAGGTTVAGGTLQASSTSGSVAFGSDLSVGNTTTIAAGNGIALGGNSKLVGATALQSTTGTISNNGVLATNQTLTVSGNADLLNQGSLQSAGNMTLAAHNITSSAGSASAITTGGALNANATGALNLNNTVSVTAKTTIALASTGGGSNAGTIQAGNAISLSGGNLANSGQIASQTVSSTGGISNTGTVYGSDTVAVAGSTTNTGQIVATNSVNLGTTGNSGVIQAQTVSLGSTSNGGSIAGNTVTASSMSNSGSVGATNNISVSGDVNNTGAVAASNISFNGGTLVNSGQVHASGNITINASSINNTAEVVAPIPGVPENTNIPYASSGAIKADGILAISGGSLNNTGTLSSGGVFNIAMGGGISNNKRGFILSGGDITMTAAGVSNDGIVYGINGAPATVTVASTGGFANGSTGVLLAGNQLTITATGFTNAGDNINSGVGSLGNANLSTVGGWDAGANPLKANGLLTVNTNGITVNVGKTWEAQNVKWNGTLTNYGTVNLGVGQGAVHNESTGTTLHTTAPDPVALAGSYDFNPNAPSGYTGATLVGYTDVTNRARFTASSFTGSFANIAGDISGNINAIGGGADIVQNVIWSGVPVGSPGAPPEEVAVASASKPRAYLTAGSVINLVGPSAGTVVGTNVTINAADLTVDKSNTGAAQGGISSAQGLTVGTISGSPAVLALLQNPGALNAAALQNAALVANQQANAIASGTVTTTVGTPSNLGSAGTFTTNPSAPSGAPSGEGGSTLALPAPDLSTVQGAFTALNAQKVNTIVTDWQALGAQANAINVTNLTLNLSGTLTNAGSINATSGLKITAAGGIDNSGGLLKAGEWVQLDSQGLGLINSGGTIQSGGGIKATITGDTGNVVNNGGTISAVDSAVIKASGNISATGGSFTSTTGNFVLLADGNLTMTNSKLSAVNGQAAIDVKGNVTFDGVTQGTSSTTTVTTVAPTATQVPGGWDSDTSATAANQPPTTTTTTSSSSTTTLGSTVEGSSVFIKAGGNIDGTAVTIRANASANAKKDPNAAPDAPDHNGTVALIAGGNVNLRSAVDTNTSSTQTSSSTFGNTSGNSSSQSSSQSSTTQTLAAGSVSASKVIDIQAGKQVTLAGVNLSGDKGIFVTGKEGVTQGAIALTSTSSGASQTVTTNTANLIDGQSEDSATTTVNTTSKSNSTTFVGSTFTSTAGAVSVRGEAGTLTIAGSDIKAAGPVSLQGQDVNVIALQNQTSTSSTSSQVGGGMYTGGSLEGQTGSASLLSTGGNIQGAGGVSIVAATAAPAAAATSTSTDSTATPAAPVGGTVTLQGANIQSGGAITLAGANVVVAANVDSVSTQTSSGTGNYQRIALQSTSGAGLQAAGSINVIATANKAAAASDTASADSSGLVSASSAVTTTPGQGNISLTGATLKAGVATLGVNPDDVPLVKAANGTDTLKNGAVNLIATGTIDIGAAQTKNSTDIGSTSSSSGFFSSKTTVQRNTTTDNLQIGSTITGTSITAQAGGNITGTGAQLATVDSGTTKAGDVLLNSINGNVDLKAGTDTHTTTSFRQEKQSGLFSTGGMGIMLGSQTKTEDGATSNTVATTSSYGGNKVTIASGKNVTITGTDVVSDKGTHIQAVGNVTLDAAFNQSTTRQSTTTSASGLFLDRNVASLGTKDSANSSTTTTVTAAGTTVGAVDGNITISAGRTFAQSGSHLVAPAGNVAVKAQNIVVQSAQEQFDNVTMQSMSQSGITVSLSNPVVEVAQGAQQTINMAQATTQVNGGRLQALGAATTALSGYNTAQQINKIAQNPADLTKLSSISVDVSVGRSESKSVQTSSITTNAASTIAAGGTVSLTATGAGTDSNINIIGSTIKAGKDVNLTADNQVNIVAATNTGVNTNSTSGSSASIGVGFNLGSNTGFTLNASASKNQGQGNGKDTSYSNSAVTAGGTATVKSGGDTNLVGGTITANKVVTDIGGDLNIASPQATSTYTESSSSSGFGVKLCLPPLCAGSSTFTVSAGQNNIDSNFQSTGEASGIRAGDGGFQVKVDGKTTLTGGQITSTQVAVDKNLNTYSAAGGTTTTDLANSANYKAEGISLSAGYSTTLGDQSSPAAQQAMRDRGMSPEAIRNAVTTSQAAGKPTGSVGMGQASGEASSTTVSGITGFAGNQNVRTGDASTALTTIFDKDKVKNDVNAQVNLTATFGQLAPKAVGDYADTMYRTAKTDEERARWAEGGPARVALHVVVGGLAGGTPGATGAGVSQAVVPTIAKAIEASDLPEPLKQTLTAAAGTAVGAVVGGPAGGAAGFNATVNNFLNHQEASRRAQLMQQKAACKTDSCAAPLQSEINRLNELDVWRDQQIAQACTQPGSAACSAWTNAIQLAANSYTGQDSSDPLVHAERSNVLNNAFKFAQANKNPFLNGVGRGLLKLTPVGLVADAGVGAYALTTSLINNGKHETAISIIQGIADLPSNIVTRLGSSDPAVRGEALVDAIALGSVATAVTGKMGITVLENAFTGPTAGSLNAQRGIVNFGANGGVVPSGFANANEFANFGGNVRGGLKSAGYPDVEPILQGSAVTGKSFGTGAPFDVGRVSDFDVALASPSLLQRAQDLGIGVRSGGTRTGPLSARDLEALGLTKFASQISTQAGREVNFMIYQSPAAAVQRAPSVSLPGGK